jgi:unsaturated chondroitin disaccharide hydrolase
MIAIKAGLKPNDLAGKLGRLWTASAAKLDSIEKTWAPSKGAPVFTVEGRYTSKGWTEWTQGFQFGSALLQFDATGDKTFLAQGRDHTFKDMAGHITHMGVHDHGFNNVSTYGNLLRLIAEGKVSPDGREKDFHELAIKCSGAVQARRWTRVRDGRGFIHSFNGPHSLFADTIRSLRSLALSHKLGHTLLEERDLKVNLLERLVQHAAVTAEYTVFYGEGRDAYDLRGRCAHEIIFNTADGNYRCPNSQQGYSPFSTWTRGLAWVMLGYPEELEFLDTVPDAELEPLGGRAAVEGFMLKAARAVCDFYLEHTPVDGIPYWDTGAPELHRLGDYLGRPADPFNDHEPVDSSAACIAAQGLLRLGHWLRNRDAEAASRYFQAGLTVADRLFEEPYLSTDASHQGLVLHSVYHRPNGWDHVPAGARIPRGESSMWGDYHGRELALYLSRLVSNGPYHAFHRI